MISDGDLSLRIPTRGTDDDYDLLSENINQMLNQINGLMQGVQNISNNIAHDLRSNAADQTRLFAVVCIRFA